MTTATVLGEHFFWITSRAAGVAALLASSAAVTLGLLMGGRLLKGRLPDLRVTHEALSLATLAALLVHALALLGDSYMSPSLADISLPLVSSYRTFWTTLGIVAGWGMIILGLSFYARGRIGPARWRRLHRFTALAWILGVAHGLGEGTDAGSAWFLLSTAAVVLPAAALLAVRLAPASTQPGAPRTPRRSMPVSRRAVASAPTAMTRPPRSSTK
jgi:methionine sulfoxide reductase heme-binding subunit